MQTEASEARAEVSEGQGKEEENIGALQWTADIKIQHSSGLATQSRQPAEPALHEHQPAPVHLQFSPDQVIAAALTIHSPPVLGF